MNRSLQCFMALTVILGTTVYVFAQASQTTPRTDLTDQVYTSTEYPAHLEVFLHNELSYAGWSPGRVFFCCLVPAETGGRHL